MNMVDLEVVWQATAILEDVEVVGTSVGTVAGVEGGMEISLVGAIEVALVVEGMEVAQEEHMVVGQGEGMEGVVEVTKVINCPF